MFDQLRERWERLEKDDSLALAGVVLATIGFFGWWWPAAFLWLGGCCLVAAFSVARGPSQG